MLVTNLGLPDLAARSVGRAALGLLPALGWQRLGMPRTRIVGLLDQLRPVDAVPLARRVATPALVVVGRRDLPNQGPSAALARALPLGRLRVLPGAGADWTSTQPERAATALADLLQKHLTPAYGPSGREVRAGARCDYGSGDGARPKRATVG